MVVVVDTVTSVVVVVLVLLLVVSFVDFSSSSSEADDSSSLILKVGSGESEVRVELVVVVIESIMLFTVADGRGSVGRREGAVDIDAVRLGAKSEETGV